MHADNEPDLDRDAPIVSATTSVMASLNYHMVGDQTTKIYGNFKRFFASWCLVWVGNIMTFVRRFIH